MFVGVSEAVTVDGSILEADEGTGAEMGGPVVVSAVAEEVVGAVASSEVSAGRESGSGRRSRSSSPRLVGRGLMMEGEG
jgi:hypothetical protein